MSRGKPVSKPSVSPETPAHLVSIRASPYSTGVRSRFKCVLTDKVVLGWLITIDMLFTRRLVILITVAAFPVALGGVSSFFAWLGLVANLVLILAFLIDWMNTPPLSQVSARRFCEEKLSLGARNVVEIRLRSRANVSLALEVKDEPPPLFDVSEDVIPLTLPADSESTVSYTIIPKERGNYEFGSINIRYLSRFGLFKRRTKIAQSVQVKVYPNLLEVRKYVILARRGRFSETGLKHSKLYGAGTRFESLRDYLPDDDYRRINWNATARTGRPISEEYEHERSQNITIMLDCGRMMTAVIKDMSRLDYAINSALMLGYVCCVKGDKVGLVAFSDNVEAYISPRGGKQQLYRIADALYDISPKMRQPDYEKAFTFVESKLRRRSLIVVFTDLIDVEISKTLTAYLPRLRQRHLVLCITLKDTELARLADEMPDTVEDVYQKAVAGQLLLEQQGTLRKLQQNGVLVLDSTPENLSVATVNRYLELKGRNLI